VPILGSNDAGRQIFDRTVYGSAGNTGNTGGGGGGSTTMGSPDQVMAGLRAAGKIPRRPARGKRPRETHDQARGAQRS
jgi:hypothetical protein